MASGVPFKTDAYRGTGTALNITKVGFKPRRVELVNQDDALMAVWQDTMADDSAFIQKGSSSSFITSGGITPIANGFTVGTNADLNTDGEQVHFIAYR